MNLTKIKLLSLFCLMVGNIAFSQTVFDYTAWSTSQCNAFGNSPVINGHAHKSMYGQPLIVTSGGGGIEMPTWYTGSTQKGTKFEIDFFMNPFRQYNVTVRAALYNPSSGVTPNLFVYPITANTPTSTDCNGPVTMPVDPSGSQGYTIVGSSWDYQYSINIGNYYLSKLIVSAFPDPSGAGTPSPVSIVIQKITITDVTTNPPNFTTTSNIPSVKCGSEGAVTFTINNISNTPGVTGYAFECEPGKWLYNGNPATTVTSATNTIALTPVSCTGAGWVKGHLKFGALDLAATPVTINKTTPNYIISGPSTLNNFGAIYKLNTNPIVFPPPSTIFVCNALPTWSNSSPFLATMTVNNDREVGLAPNNGANGNVTITATMNMCEQTVTASRTIAVVGPIGGLMPYTAPEELSIKRIYPNPNNGSFKIELNGIFQNTSVDVVSVDGKSIFNKEFTGTRLDVNLTGVSSGLYFVKIRNGVKTIIEKVTVN